MNLEVECVLGIMTCDMAEDASASCRLSFNTLNLELVVVLYKKKKKLMNSIYNLDPCPPFCFFACNLFYFVTLSIHVT